MPDMQITMKEIFKGIDNADDYKWDYEKGSVNMFYKGFYYGNISFYGNIRKYAFQPTLFCDIEDKDEYSKVMKDTTSVVRSLSEKVA